MTSGPEFNSTSRRGFLALCAAIPLALGACSASPKAPASSPPVQESTGFPFTVEHVYGSTVVERPFTKVLTVGGQDSESMLALGLAPIARTGDNVSAWYGAALRALGPDPMPQLVDYTPKPLLQAAKDIRPQLIISVSQVLPRALYDSLSKIAPVVLAPKTLNVESWADVQRFYGKVLGVASAAEDVVKTTTDDLAQSIKDYPGIKGKTALFVRASSAKGADIQLYTKDSSPLRLLREVGFVPAPSLDQVLAHPGNDADRQGASAYIPQTEAKSLTADVIMLAVPYADYQNYKASKDLTLFPKLGKGEVYVVTTDNAFGFEKTSSLGASWLGRNVVPELAKFAYLSTKA